MRINKQKNLLLLGASFLLGIMASAQIELPAKYKTRELNAPVLVKNRIAAQRILIGQQKLKYNVGFTGVSNKTLAQNKGEQEKTPQEISRGKKNKGNRKMNPEAKKILQ